jgi:S1-C subfamily serine protease
MHPRAAASRRAAGEGDGSPRIDRVADDSVAEIAGLKPGDQVVRAAGLAMPSAEDLMEVVARQAPGTWLPLSIRRDGQEIDIIAKFPNPRAN